MFIIVDAVGAVAVSVVDSDDDDVTGDYLVT